MVHVNSMQKKVQVLNRMVLPHTPPKANDLNHKPIHRNLDVIEAVNSSFASLVLRWPFSLDEPTRFARRSLLARRVGVVLGVDLVGLLVFIMFENPAFLTTGDRD